MLAAMLPVEVYLDANKEQSEPPEGTGLVGSGTTTLE
jgi:hypothetical protein